MVQKRVKRFQEPTFWSLMLWLIWIALHSSYLFIFLYLLYFARLQGLGHEQKISTTPLGKVGGTAQSPLTQTDGLNLRRAACQIYLVEGYDNRLTYRMGSLLSREHINHRHIWTVNSLNIENFEQY